MRIFRRPGSYLAEERLLADAEHRVLERCMRRKGVQLRFPPAQSDRIIGRLRPDLEFRREHGYGFIEQRPRPVSGYREPEGSRGRAALARKFFGDEDHVISVHGPETSGTIGVEGCYGEARRAVAGTIHRYDDITSVANEYSALIGLRIGQSHRYLGRPMHRWSQCMALRDHAYDDLNGPYADAKYAFEYANPKPTKVSRHEIRVAVDDAECQIAAGLPAVVGQMQDDLVASLPPADRRRLRYIARARARAVVRARRIIRDEPGS